RRGHKASRVRGDRGTAGDRQALEFRSQVALSSFGRVPYWQPLIRGRGPSHMSAHAIAKARRRKGAVLTWAFAGLVRAVAASATFVSDVLWPSWPSEPVALDGPALPITVAGTLFGVPPAAIRETVQRHPGQHERVDLVFSWPALTPAAKTRTRDKAPVTPESALAAVSQAENNRLFVTIAA